ncbi:Ubiquitin carboxyl-terminal hydrolase 25 [Chionoecetes opilio]|uniref:Ubiquitin carboxyl-terminal hydrolase 25 n=1 Tax=Chionoecetes opilio TaxID=41210 RepID=A0A8J4YLB4_CHIOP|nr:Ubiquitin carboxyl-terminal hydrolase 25 [Chionoecetes opilio]
MCGVAQDTAGQSDTVHPLEAAMPPSITLGSEPPKPAGGLGERPPHQDPPPGKDIPTIDLSCDESDDLQKAIALSLQDQEGAATLQGMSAEEQEISRAMEASLKDSQPQATVDLLNPRERCRLPGRPVGLKNIGNSCWFNVVIQPLFHIPVFRDLILDFPQSLEMEEHMDESHKGPQLVPALRRLFALMIGSHRKYVDPSRAVQVFQGQEMRRNAQQDVCEFTHKLLERLEEEFQQLLRGQGVEKESSGRHISKDADFDNPIMKLFYGQAKKEACEGGSEREQQEQQQQQLSQEQQEAFGQYPLRVTNFRHIHDSILASMSSSVPAEPGPAAPPRQETWFKMLPPVLIFSLSRYEYSHEKKRAEKVHNKFEFPEYLYMDRYMEANKELVREKQVRVACLRNKLGALNRTLDRYLKYGSGAAQYPIADILRYTLDFAQAGGQPGQDAPSPPMMEVDGAEDDVEMTEDGLEWLPRPSPAPREEEEEGAVDSGSGAGEQRPLQQIPSPSKRMRLLPPAPRSISGAELATLQSCLVRWLKDVTGQVEELRRLIGELEDQLSQVYEEPALRQVPYRLHAAVVHEGQASGGHYWVYIQDPVTGGWMKFNDIQVVEASWQEVMQDSVGGHNNTSAYCLLYMDQGRYPTLFPSAPKSQEELLASLALDLQEHIKGDNQAFSRELEEWDARQEGVHTEVPEGPAEATLPVATPNSPDVVCLRESEESKFFIDIETMLTHMVREALTKASDKATPSGHVLYPLLNQQVTRLQKLDVAHSDTNGLYCEPSLLDFGVYLMRNLQKYDVLVQVYGCEVVLQVARSLTQRSPLVEQAEREAIHQLRQLMDKQRRAEDNQYKGWLRHYHSLVDCTWHLVYGFKQQQRGALEGALPQLLRACQIHRELQERPPTGNRKTLDGQVLCQARNSCLLALNKRVLDTFEKGEAEQLGELPGVVNSLIVPALAQLLSSDTEEDRTTVEHVRKRWCDLLHQEWQVVAPAKSEMVKPLMIAVMSVGSEAKSSGPFQTPHPPSVVQLYKDYTKCCTDIMAEPYPAPPSPTASKAQTSDL